ncbi:uncharacterized protein VTP21DRAFT_2456 [Calcarisporiella thermophila]|uniref:uncharacterized protein n=1 Tax=Calcarisporiella thermophila TaxID=911321 RepID=UPI0037449F40
MANPPVTLSDIKAAHDRIKPYIHQTPALTSSTFDSFASTHAPNPRQFTFKCENFQKIGAFKFRGATNAVMQLPEEVKFVLTHSSGNHGQALALAARERGINSCVVVPKNAPLVKREAIRGYGARVVECEPNIKAREETCNRLAAELGGVILPPFDHPHIIAGQGTTALELIEQMQYQVDAIIAPVGGGGLLSGCAIAAKGLVPGIKVFAAEPEGADDCKRSFDSKTWHPSVNPNTVADSLLPSTGKITFPLILENVDAVFTVSDEQIIQAMKFLWERMKIIVEPGSATVAAVALYNKEFLALQGIHRVGLVLSGGNVDLDRLPWIKSNEK